MGGDNRGILSAGFHIFSSEFLVHPSRPTSSLLLPKSDRYHFRIVLIPTCRGIGEGERGEGRERGREARGGREGG